MTFVLVAVVYAVAIGKPSFSETGPLAVGFSLWASAIVGEQISDDLCDCPPLKRLFGCCILFVGIGHSG